MKNLAFAMVLVAVLGVTQATPAHAFSLKRAARHVTLRKVLGAPFYCVGFTVALVADLTVIPLTAGAEHYIKGEPITGW